MNKGTKGGTTLGRVKTFAMEEETKNILLLMLRGVVTTCGRKARKDKKERNGKVLKLDFSQTLEVGLIVDIRTSAGPVVAVMVVEMVDMVEIVAVEVVEVVEVAVRVLQRRRSSSRREGDFPCK